MKRRARKLYPSADGRMIRFTRPTAAETRRKANSASWRVGADVVSWIRDAALTVGCTQGELVRALLLAGRAVMDAGELEIENGRWRRQPDPNSATDLLGRIR